MNAYILLDRTGSMGPIWTEALGSVNAYVAQLAKDEDPNDKTRITIACFDHQETLQFEILRRDVTAETFRPLTDADASPRGMTPLFDAIVRIAALAEKDAPEKAVLIVMTDGEENSSQEVTKQGAAAALDRIRTKGWQVVFLGANFDAFGEAGDDMRVERLQRAAASGQARNSFGVRTRMWKERPHVELLMARRQPE